ncbi:MAG: asparagine synthase (glutamine-hydrolyzing) [Pseudomonadota bacterium]
MCGIAGIWRLFGRAEEADQADVRAMIDAVAHRGPDGTGFWAKDQITLGHCRLAILDTSDRGLQPAITPDSSGVLVYNGEVYNFRELRQELEESGVRFVSQSDTEVVLWALHRWGVENAIRRFNGMFAFAYYDTRKNALWLCRDRLGIKAMSIAHVGERLIFASEDKAILAVSAFDKRIDTRALTLSLALQYTDSHLSSFADIRRLPPGACWRFDSNGMHEGRFWEALKELDFQRLCDKRIDVEKAKQNLETGLRDSVGLHCISDVDLATACSSGVDSGMVTALSRDFVGAFPAYVIDPDQGVNEFEGAQRTCKRLGVPLRRVHLDQATYLRSMAQTVFHVENGNLATGTPALLAMTRQCKQDGLKVLLTGEGSDELFGGYGWHAQSARHTRFTAFLAALGPTQKARRRRMERLARSPFRNAISASHDIEHQIHTSSMWAEYNLMQQEIMETLSPLASVHDRAFAGNGIFDLYAHMQCIIHRHDRLSMAASIELRVPFLENSIIDFAINLPPALKYRNKTGKWILKEVALKYLPQENIMAKKKGFPVTNDYLDGTEALLKNGALRELMSWSTRDADAIAAMCKTNKALRLRLVGHEVLARIYASGTSPDEVGETLVSAASA